MRTRATSSSTWSSSRLVALLVAAASALPAGAAVAREAGEVPSVDLNPVATTDDDPNDGQWFVAEAEPGERVTFEAEVVNPADVPQRVRLYLADLRVADDGTPSIGSMDAGLGTWGGFAERELVVEPGRQATAAFELTVPADAEPGDHLGAVVAEAQPAGEGSVRVVKRTANRLYVTVPGDADPAIEIESVEVRTDRALLPRTATVSVVVRNTGNVRVAPEVVIGGRTATGADLVMSRLRERYEVEHAVPLWGGRLRYDVRVDTSTSKGEGPSDRDEASTLVVPWWILLALFLLVLAVLTVRELRRRLA